MHAYQPLVDQGDWTWNSGSRETPSPGIPYSQWRPQRASTRPAAWPPSPPQGRFLKTVQCVPRPKVQDCDSTSLPPSCPAARQPLPPRKEAERSCRAPHSPPHPLAFLPRGSYRGLGDVATLCPCSASGFPDLRTLRLARAQAPARLGVLPSPHCTLSQAFEEYHWETDLA